MNLDPETNLEHVGWPKSMGPWMQQAHLGNYPSEVAKEIMTELLPEWQEHFLSKNAGYGDMSEVLGPKAQFVDIHRKVGKLRRSLWEEKDIGTEEVEEVTMDLIGHCFLLLDILRGRGK